MFHVNERYNINLSFFWICMIHLYTYETFQQQDAGGRGEIYILVKRETLIQDTSHGYLKC